MHRYFLVGCPRSGTTLLQQIIVNYFPEIHSVPETQYFSIANPINPIKKFVGWKNLFVQGYNKKLAKKLNLSYKSKYNTPLIGRDYYKGFIELMDDSAKQNDKQIWLEKTPRHLHFIDDISNIPNSKFIHIIRKGEDVVSSLFSTTNTYPKKWGNKNFTKFKGFSIDQCINRWNNDISITLNYKNDVNHLIISYEQLITNINESVSIIQSFVKLKPQLSNVGLSNNTRKLIENRELWKANNFKDVIRNRSNFESIFNSQQKHYIRRQLKSNLYMEIES